MTKVFDGFTLKEFEIGKLSINPGDIVVVKCPMRLRDEERRHVKESMEYLLKDSGMNNRIIILEQGIDINILVREELKGEG